MKDWVNFVQHQLDSDKNCEEPHNGEPSKHIPFTGFEMPGGNVGSPVGQYTLLLAVLTCKPKEGPNMRQISWAPQWFCHLNTRLGKGCQGGC